MVGPTILASLLSLSAHAAPIDTTTLAPTMQWQVQELSVVRRVAPAYPAGITVEDLRDVACRASVRIGGDGVPLAVVVEGCPSLFAQETQRAISDWRWSSWSSVAERRVTLTVRFPRPPRLGVTAPAPASLAAGAGAAPTPAAAAGATPADPSYAGAVHDGDPARTASEDVVCSAEIVRNRTGVAVRSQLRTCPEGFRDAAAGALKELRRRPGTKVGEEAPRQRIEDVKITFQVAER